MKTLIALAFFASAGAALAQPPPRDQFQDAAVTVKGDIVRADTSAPAAKLHIVEASTGKAWVVEGPSSNTLVRSGVAGDLAKGSVLVVGFPQKGPCAAECRIRMREITFPDGRKVFLGVPGTAPL